jgi:hypothetical protein
MDLPSNSKLPFFAYGTFKPGQLAFFRIKQFVDRCTNDSVKGQLWERDAVPLLVPTEIYPSDISGNLIFFQSGGEELAYKEIIAIEPSKIYCWEEVTTKEGVIANTLVGKDYEIGSKPYDGNCWDGRNDPFFTEALEEIDDILHENIHPDPNSLKPLFRVQMAYLLLWIAIERYASLRYHLGSDRESKRKKCIASEKAFQEGLKKHIHKKNREIFSANELLSYKLDPNNPQGAINYYYQVRSNSIHRGKAVYDDYEILKYSCRELLNIFKDMLEDAWKIQDI